MLHSVIHDLLMALRDFLWSNNVNIVYFKMWYEWGQLSPRINTHLFKSVDPVKKLVMLIVNYVIWQRLAEQSTIWCMLLIPNFLFNNVKKWERRRDPLYSVKSIYYLFNFQGKERNYDIDTIFIKNKITLSYLTIDRNGRSTWNSMGFGGDQMLERGLTLRPATSN